MAKSVARLSPMLVKSIKEPGYYCDGAGLYLQVSASLSKSWVLRYTVDGKKREMGLGAVTTVALADAREKARQWRLTLLDGQDPIEARRAKDRDKKLATAKQRTFDQCAAEYLTSHGSKWKNAKHAQQWENTLKVHASPIFGAALVADVDKALILRAVEPIWTSKTETATRLLQRVRTVLEWSASMDYRPSIDSGLWSEIRRVLPSAAAIKKQTSEHFAACPYREVFSAIATVKASTAAATTARLLEFVILTACRSGEGRGMTWGEVDLDGQRWTIPAARMKAGREHRIPLSDRAIELLLAERTAQGYINGKPPVDALVFPSVRGKVPSDMILTMLLRRLNIPYTAHGFRSTFRDWCAEQTNYPREICEAALAHSVRDQTEEAYFRSDMFEKRRELMQTWATYCTTEPVDSAQVIPILKNRA